MNVKTKIWLWIALVLSVYVTCMNVFEGRWPSVGIAVIALVGLCMLLFKSKKLGYYIMCICYLCAFVVGIYEGTQWGTSILMSVVMSFIGSALIPVVTFLFIRSQWNNLK